MLSNLLRKTIQVQQPAINSAFRNHDIVYIGGAITTHFHINYTAHLWCQIFSCPFEHTHTSYMCIQWCAYTQKQTRVHTSVREKRQQSAKNYSRKVGPKVRQTIIPCGTCLPDPEAREVTRAVFGVKRAY